MPQNLGRRTRGPGAARPWAPRATDDRGVTLIEVVIAAVLLGILASAVLGILLKTQSAEVGNRGRVAAANLAAREIDLVREEFLRTDAAPLAIAAAGTVTNPHQLDGGSAGDPLVVDGTGYTVVRSVAWNITGDGSSACEGGSLVVYPTMSVTVSITWPTMGTIAPVVSTATLAPEKGNGIPGTASFVAVKVTNAAGEPSAGRGVTVAGGSETHTGLTDASGCAVIEVAPAAGTGTTYSAQLTDAGYVDISGSSSPTKSVGLLARGQLNNNVTFSYDLAGSVTLRFVDESGNPIDASTVHGQVTLVASEGSGSTSSTPISVSGSAPTITGLWPTLYGAYFGTTAPGGGYTSLALDPGGALTLDVTVAPATGAITGAPVGTVRLWAVPSGEGTCTASSAEQLSSPFTYSLLPGSWDLFAEGSDFTCSPGPAAQALAAGPNDDVVWGVTTLRVTGVASVGTLWALDVTKVGSAPATCPTGAALASARNIDAARASAVALPAGNWLLFVTNGAANGTCLSYPTSINPTSVPYGVATTRAWTSTISLTVNKLTASRYVVVVPQALKASGSNYACDATKYTYATGSTGTTALGPTTSSSKTVTTTVATGTWYVYQWNKSGSGSYRCTQAGVVSATGFGPYTLDASTGVVTP